MALFHHDGFVLHFALAISRIVKVLPQSIYNLIYVILCDSVYLKLKSQKEFGNTGNKITKLLIPLVVRTTN